MINTEKSVKFPEVFSILIVEDNQVNMKLTKILIGNHFPKAIIYEAFSGQDAVAIFKETTLDIILMDIQMPVMSGYDTAKAIRAIEVERGGRVPIIALTASVLQDEMPSCIDAGMDAFLNKPIDKQAMFSLLNEWLAI